MRNRPFFVRSAIFFFSWVIYHFEIFTQRATKFVKNNSLLEYIIYHAAVGFVNLLAVIADIDVGHRAAAIVSLGISSSAAMVAQEWRAT